MKILSLCALLTVASTGHARVLRLNCEPLDREQKIEFTTDTKVLTKAGSRLAKFSGVYERQAIVSSVNPLNQTMQITMQLPNGDRKTMIKVNSAEEAATIWDQLRAPLRPASLLPMLMPNKVAEEYLRYVSMKSAQDVYLVLLSSEREFGYAGYCNLKVR